VTEGGVTLDQAAVLLEVEDDDHAVAELVESRRPSRRTSRSLSSGHVRTRRQNRPGRRSQRKKRSTGLHATAFVAYPPGLTSLPARDRGRQDDSQNHRTYETGSAQAAHCPELTKATGPTTHRQPIRVNQVARIRPSVWSRTSCTD
jgi:hypothetical protein